MSLEIQEDSLRSSLRVGLSDLIVDLFVPFLIHKAEHICIINPPGHPNVGDSAILLGEMSFQKK